MDDVTDVKTALALLARHLAARRAVILRNWQRSVEADPELTTSSNLSRAQFNDHIPQVLAAFERRLEARRPLEKEVAFEDQRNSAAEHGVHRWQQVITSARPSANGGTCSTGCSMSSRATGSSTPRCRPP